jgi:putative ABC transport system permease protein
MSLNVIERTREIGIMRAIGASNGAIMQIVLAEGLLIGLLSWGLGTLLALPVSRLLSDGLGELLFADPLAFHFSLTGGLIWLLLSVALALGASLLPARNATRVSVRDVLAYE